MFGEGASGTAHMEPSGETHEEPAPESPILPGRVGELGEVI